MPESGDPGQQAHSHATRQSAMSQADKDRLHQQELNSRAAVVQLNQDKLELAKTKAATELLKEQRQSAEDEHTRAQDAERDAEAREVARHTREQEAKREEREAKREDRAHALELEKQKHILDAAESAAKRQRQQANQAQPQASGAQGTSASASSSHTALSPDTQQNALLSALLPAINGIQTSLAAAHRQNSAPQIQDLKKDIISAVEAKSIDNGPSTLKVTIDPNKVDSIENLYTNIRTQANTLSQAKEILQNYMAGERRLQTDEVLEKLRGLIDTAETEGVSQATHLPTVVVDLVRAIEWQPGRPQYWCDLCRKHGSHSTERCFKANPAWNGFPTGHNQQQNQQHNRGGPPPPGHPQRRH